MGFLRDEVRSGFYIPTAIKQAWATQLKILFEIDKICEKHNIQYFAEWGTLLGAVRHGGFVPWDDDLDIGMKRADYQKFMEVAKDELPSGYAIHNYETKEDHWLFLSRVVNKNQICFDKDHLDEFYNFPYIATVDIFVSDYRYKDETLEQQRCEEVKRIIALADGIVEGKYNDASRCALLDELNSRYGTSIKEYNDVRKSAIELYKLAECQMARTSLAESDRIVQLFPWGLKGNKGLPKEYYEEFVRLPFENTTIPVPAQYHKVLQSRYGDYMTVHKVWGGHDYPYFEGQRANLQKVADFKLPEFTFGKQMLRENQIINKSESVKSISQECLNELENQGVLIKNLIIENDFNFAVEKLSEVQQLAIDFGTLLENVYGADDRDVKIVVGCLEKYCEAVFELYECINAGDVKLQQKVDTLQESLYSVKDAAKIGVIDKREVLFLPNCSTNWNAFQKYYKQYADDERIRVSIVPLPVMRKDAYGQMISSAEEIESLCEGYPEELNILSWDMYDISLRQPEIVYIQDPYDGENPCLTVPPVYYAENMQKYTEKIVYVTAYQVSEFGADDTTDLYNMKHYVTAPGVVRADEIIVQSENMKQRYLERLVQFAGAYTREIWERKLKVAEQTTEDNVYTSCEKKRMLYCVGLNEIAENQYVEELIAHKLNIFGEHANDIEVTVCTYPAEIKCWDSRGTGVIESIKQLIAPYENMNWCEYSKQDFDKMVETHDAYYGSPCVLAHKFQNNCKPVMMATYFPEEK